MKSIEPSIETNVPLAPLTTLKCGGLARYYANATSLRDVEFLCDTAEKYKTSIHVLGGGSNTFFADGCVEKFVIKINIRGIEIVEDRDTSHDTVCIRSGAGEVWDDLVAWTVERGFSGIEALSAIPGTVGAAPVQNIGAYGAEIKDVIVGVHGYDYVSKNNFSYSNEECLFLYRDSIFKKENNSKIITHIDLRLSRRLPTIPQYPDVINYFNKPDSISISSQVIRNAIIEIRSKKLPDWHIYPNAGSFFKNPYVSEQRANEIATHFPDMPRFDIHSIPEKNETERRVKLSAGWLIEKAGYKGVALGPILVWPKNALVLVNEKKGNAVDIQKAVQLIRSAVKEKFSIDLEQEPIFIQ